MKKIILILITTVLVVSAGILTMLFLNNKDNDVLSGLEDDRVIVKDLKPAKLTFYFDAREHKDTREVLEQVEKRAKNLNIKLDFKFIYNYPQVYIEQIKAIIAAGQPCDAFYFSGGFPVSLRALAEDNVIKDISKIFPQYAPGYYKNFSEEEISAASVDGKIYAVPNRLPSTQMRCAIVREDLMKKYNIPDIKSYEDYEIYLKTIKENEKDMTPMIFYETAIGLFGEANGYVILDYQQGLVYKWDDPDMKIMAWEQTPEFRKGIEKIHKWYTEGYILKNNPFVIIDDSIISSGKFASAIANLGKELEYNSILKNKNINWHYKAYPLYPEKVSERSSPMDGAIVISEKSNNAERVLMFIDWLQSGQENYDSLMYGIKGKHYLLVKDRIKLPDDIKEGEGFFSAAWRYPFCNIDNERTDIFTSEDAVKEYSKKIKENTKYPPHMGFVPDYGAVEDIKNKRKMLFYSTEQKIFTGTFKNGDIDEFIKQHKDGGADLLVNEVQKQLDQWKNTSR